MFVILALGVLMRLNNALRYPSLHGYDSYAHVSYVWHLLRAGDLPLPSDGWGRFHPPLYYAACAGIWRVLGHMEPSQVLKVIALVFAIASLVPALVSYVIARRYFSGQLVPLLAPALVLLLPVNIYTAPMFGNETLTVLLCSLALYLLLRAVQKESLTSVAGLGITVGFALLTKFTSIAYVVIAVAVLALQGLRTRQWRPVLKQVTLLGVLVLLIAGWFYGRNLYLYGTPFQMSRQYFVTRRIEANQATGRRDLLAYLTFDRRIFKDPLYVSKPVVDSVWTGAFASTWFDAFANWFLPYNSTTRTVGRILLVLGVVPTVLVVVGLCAGVWRLSTRGWDDVLVVMYVATGVVLAMFVAYTFENRVFAAVKASYMLPAIVPFSFWFTLGVATIAVWPGPWLRMALVALSSSAAVIIPVYTYQLLFELGLGGHYWNVVGVVDYFAGFRDQAREKFSGVVRSENLYLAHENLGSLALEEEHVDGALSEFREAMRLLPTQALGGGAEDTAMLVQLTRADYLNSLAVIYDRLGRDRRALESARAAVRLDPTLPEAYYDLAVLLLKRGSVEAALPAIQRAIELDPGFSAAHFLLGVAQQQAGDCARAVTTLSEASAVTRWPRRTYPHAVGTGDIHDAAIVRRRRIMDLPPILEPERALAACRDAAHPHARRRGWPCGSGETAPGTSCYPRSAERERLIWLR
jgi:tetratricopeptide (TPR) repeat protein